MKFRVIIFLFSLPIVMIAQNAVLRNHPKYYQDGDYWMQALVQYDFEKSGSRELSLYVFYIEGDTIIDNKEYKCVHAKSWSYRRESLSESIEIDNILFMREEADGKQWRRLAYLDDEALLFDFSKPFEEGQIIRFCQHECLSDLLEEMYYVESQGEAHSAPSQRNGIKVWRSSEAAPDGYTYYNYEVNNVSTLELPNGEQVPFADGRIAFGWGDVYLGDLWHQYITGWESLDGRFLYRVHQGLVILKNQDTIQRVNNIIGTDVLSLFNQSTGIMTIGNIKKNKEFPSNTIYDLSGRKIANGQEPRAKGLYIVNGKKIVVK